MIIKKKILSNEIIKRRLKGINLKDRYLFEKDIKRSINSSYTYTMKNICVFPDGKIQTFSNKIVNDYLGFASLSKLILLKKIILKIKYVLSIIFKNAFYPKKIIKDKCFIIYNRNSNGYFHWTIDTLPKILITKNIDKKITLALPDTLNIKFVVGYIFFLGFLLAGGNILQQISLIYTDVANSAVFTVLYVVIVPIIAFFLLNGGLGLEPVSTNKWGGLLVTLVLGCTGIALAFPLGIILALGRRSNLPVISMMCTLFIEFIRGVPLITLLFFGMVMLPLFLPEGIDMDGLARVLVAVTLFQAAYMAEVIRGGLQAIPQGQYEAARSIGLSYWQMNRKVVLPQAIRISIPSIVNTSIGLFKDTTLVIIVGLLDLLGIGRGALADTTWLGLAYEVYFFVSLVFFIFTFGMSRYSLYLEKKLKTGINMGAD